MDAAATLTILDLPPEILLEIFSHLRISDLCKIALMCKQFRDIAYNMRLWKYHEVVLKEDDNIDESIVPSLVQRGIQKLRIHYSSVTHLESAVRCFPVLSSLHLLVPDDKWDNIYNTVKPTLTGFASLKNCDCIFYPLKYQ